MIGGTYLVFGVGAAVVSVFVFRGAGTVMFGGTYLVFGVGAAVVSVFVFRGAGAVMFGGTYLVFGAGADDWRNVPCVWSWS